MTSASPSATRPTLLVFTSRSDGRCRRIEGFLSHVLQQRKNHDTFKLQEVASETRPDLIERFRVTAVPTLMVIEDRRVRGRLAAPRNIKEIRDFLTPWLKA